MMDQVHVASGVDCRLRPGGTLNRKRMRKVSIEPRVHFEKAAVFKFGMNIMNSAGLLGKQRP